MARERGTTVADPMGTTVADPTGTAPAEVLSGGTSSPWAPPRWASPTATVLSLAGLGVSSYLTVAHFASGVVLACPDSGVIDCEKVTTSPESVIFGVPVAALGLIFFGAMILLNLPRAWASPAALARRARLGLAASGVGFAIYLIYTELFIVHAICLWCTSAHVLAFFLFVVLLFATSLARPPTTSDADSARGEKGWCE
jgi:uncharacterized membrane protein